MGGYGVGSALNITGDKLIVVQGSGKVISKMGRMCFHKTRSANLVKVAGDFRD